MRKLNKKFASKKVIASDQQYIDDLCADFGEEFRERLENLTDDEMDIVESLFNYRDDLEWILDTIDEGYESYDNGIEWVAEGLDNHELDISDISAAFGDDEIVNAFIKAHPRKCCVDNGYGFFVIEV